MNHKIWYDNQNIYLSALIFFAIHTNRLPHVWMPFFYVLSAKYNVFLYQLEKYKSYAWYHCELLLFCAILPPFIMYNSNASNFNHSVKTCFRQTTVFQYFISVFTTIILGIIILKSFFLELFLHASFKPILMWENTPWKQTNSAYHQTAHEQTSEV